MPRLRFVAGVVVPRSRSATGRRTGPAGPIHRLGDGLTLLAVAGSPFIGLGALPDGILGLAILVRLVEIPVVGLPRRELVHHQFVLGVMAVFAAGGFIGGFLNDDPMSWDFVRILLAMGGAVLLVSTYGRSRAELEPLLKAFGIGCALLAVSTVLGRTYDGRSIGFSVHPNLLAHSCVMGLATCGALFEWARTVRGRWLWVALCGLNGYGILVSGSRGALLAVWVGGFAYLCLARRPRLVLVAISMSWLLVMSLATGVLELPPSNPLARLVDGSDENTQGSNLEREQALEESFGVISERPVFGGGFENIIRIHVVYYQGWVGGGLLGAAALMGLGLAMLALPLGQPRRSLALACGCAGVAVAWLFTNILSTRDQWLFIVLAFRFARSPLARREPADA